MRWFARRHFAPSEINVIERDGIRYDARAMYRPQGGDGQWQKFAARVRRSYAVFTGRGQQEDRALTSVPWSVGDTLTATSAGQSQALRLGAVWSAVRLICDTVSSLPVKSYRKSGDSRTPAPLPQLLRQLDDDGTLMPWLWRCVSSLMLRGNAYGLITSRDGMQFPTVIQWLDPDEVSCNDINPWAPIWYWRGSVVPTEDFVHIPWFVVAGKVQGLSPIEAYALSVSTGLQAQEYGATWFSNGGVPPGTMKNTRQTIDKTQAESISDRLVSAIKRRRPIVYGADWEFAPISVPPEQSQFLETINASASQIASIYGIPPEYVGGSTGDSMTYANVEQNQLRLNQALRPLLVRLENAFSALMPNRQRVKLNADATARADLKTRLEAYEIGLRTGLYTLDEVRSLEDLAPLPPGAPRPMPQPAPQQSRKFNPGQKRDPDGQFSDGVFSTGDKLGLARRIKLHEGETLTGSGKAGGSHFADRSTVLAAIDTPNGKRLRLGIVRDEDSRRWSAANHGSTLDLDEAQTKTVRDGLVDVREKAVNLLRDYRQQVRDEYAQQKAAGAKTEDDIDWKAFPDWEDFTATGEIRGGAWGDLAWSVELGEGDLMSLGDAEIVGGAPSIAIRVKPADAPADWEFFDETENFQDNDPASLGRLIKEIDRVSGQKS